jgi:gliding motility-associated-like protein
MKSNNFRECFVAIVCLAVFSMNLNAQFAIDQSVNCPGVVSDYLIGGGVSVSNVSCAGGDNCVASFTIPTGNTVNNFPLTNGVVLSTGNAALLQGPNNAGSSSTSFNSNTNDVDLDALTTGVIRDLCKVEFDFIPTGDTVRFQYIFASEEWPEDASTSATDVFGFFLSGPGINGTFSNSAINIALIPNTNLPVSIDNVNNGTNNTGPCDNCSYFVNNGNGSQLPYSSSNQYAQADGFTTLLTAFALVECGQTYHIKLAIADVGDYSGNSWVAIQTGSFASNAPSIEFVEGEYGPQPSNSVYEGCDGGYIHLTRPPNTSGAISVDLIIGGTATNGVDYTQVNNPITIPANANFIDIPITGIGDGLTEGNETIDITFVTQVACAANSQISLVIGEASALNVTDTDVSVYCDQNANLAVNITGGVGDYLVSWSTGQSGQNIVITDPVAGPITYTVSDGCSAVQNVTGSINVTLINYPAINVNVGSDQSLDCTQSLSISPVVSGGNGSYQYQWVTNGTNTQTTLNYLDPNPSNGTVQLVVTDGCGSTGMDIMNFEIEGVPLGVNINNASGVCGDEIIVSATVTGGVGPNYAYEWLLNNVSIATTSTVSVVVEADAIITCIVTDLCTSVQTDTTSFTIVPEDIILSIGPDIITDDCFEVVSLDIDNLEGGNGTYTYVWTLGATTIDNTSAVDISVNGNDNQIVTLTVTDNCGSTGSDNLLIDITTAELTISTPSTVQVNCLEDFTITPTVVGGSGGNVFEWETGNQVVGSAQTYSNSVLSSTNYTFTVTDLCNNMATTDVLVAVNPSQLNVIITASTTDVCPGDEVVLTANVTNPIGDVDYLWDNSSVNISVTVNPSVTTEYTVSVTDECNVTDQFSYSVQVYNTLDNPLTCPDNLTLCQGVTSEDLIDGGVEPITVDWPIELVIYEDDAFTGLGVGNGVATITDHCDNVQTINLTVNSCTTIFSNVMTPEGNGKNDFFKINGIEGYPKSRLVIYNRWGNIVLDDLDYSNDWTAEGMPEGTYFYILERSDKTQYEGTLTILR